MDDRFWTHLDELAATSDVVIDRPAGSTHPRFPEFVYPYDYGFLQGTRSGDGAGIDVWLGSRPERELTGVLVTVDLEKRDTEVKLLLGCTSEEAQHIVREHNVGGQAARLVLRPASPTSSAKERECHRGGRKTPDPSSSFTRAGRAREVSWIDPPADAGPGSGLGWKPPPTTCYRPRSRTTGRKEVRE